jgi:hypothetical protein
MINWHWLSERALTELHNLVNDSDDFDTDVADRLQFSSEQISLEQKRHSCVIISIASRSFAVSLCIIVRVTRC